MSLPGECLDYIQGEMAGFFPIPRGVGIRENVLYEL